MSGALRLTPRYTRYPYRGSGYIRPRGMETAV